MVADSNQKNLKTRFFFEKPGFLIIGLVQPSRKADDFEVLYQSGNHEEIN